MTGPFTYWKRFVKPNAILFSLLFICLAGKGYSDTLTIPQMILRSVLVNTTECRYDSSHVFRYDQNNFQFVYEAIDLSFSGHVIYRYHLKPGIEWQTTGEKTLLFPALIPGRYLFEVSAKRDQQKWSEPVEFPFEIIPPIYKRWWFLFSAVTGITAIIFLVIYRRNKAYLQRTREEFIAKQRMNEMENQAKQAMMNPHFIFNALNSIQQYINDNDRVLANKYLTKFSRLIRLNLDLVNKNLITLEEELEKLKLYLEIEQLRFGEKLNYEFMIDERLETDLIYIPSMILQPFVENSIWHGLMPSVKGGTITLHATSFDNEKMLCIEIRDDGIGINQSKHLNQTKNRRSFGTDLTIDRLKLFGKKYKRDSTVELIDRSEQNSSEHGTIVRLELPIVFEKN